MGHDLKGALEKYKRVWGYLPEPQQSEMLSLLGERLAKDADGVYNVNYLAAKCRAEIYRSDWYHTPLSEVQEAQHPVSLTDLDGEVGFNMSLESLDNKERYIIEKLYVDMMTIRQVAELMRVSATSVVYWRDLALSKLKEQYEEDE